MKILYFLFFYLFFFFITSIYSAVNLLDNGCDSSFEIGFPPWTRLGGSTSNVYTTTSQKHGGAKSCRFVDLTDTYTGRKIASETFTVYELAEIEFIGYFYWTYSGSEEPTIVYINVEIEWFDQNDSSLGIDYYQEEFELSTENDWEEVTGDAVTPPVNATKAKLIISAREEENFNNDLYIDDLFLNCDTTPPPDITGITAIVGDASCTISWNPTTADDSQYYKIYYDTSGPITDVTNTTVVFVTTIYASLGITTYYCTGLINDVTYYFTVTCIDQANNEDKYPSNYAVITPQSSEFRDNGSVTVYVSTIGDSSNPTSGNPSTAFPSINYAISKLKSTNGYDTIIILAGTYSETVSIDTNGLSIIGIDSNSVILNLNDSSSSNKITFSVSNVSNIKISNLKIINSYNAIYFNNVSNSILSNINIINCKNGIYLNSSNSNSITSNNITDNNGYGILLDSSSSNKFYYNKISNNSETGVSLISSSNNQFLMNLINSNNYQINISGNSSNDTFQKNNIISNNNVVINNTANSHNFNYNYWGTTNSDSLNNFISGTGAVFITKSIFRFSLIDTGINADTIAPVAPQNISADTTNPGEIILSWSASTTNEESGSPVNINGYKIYKSQNSEPADWQPPVKIVSSSTTQWIDTDIIEGETYYYRITAFDTHLNNGVQFSNESFYSAKLTVKSLLFDTTVPNIWYVDINNGDTNNKGYISSQPKKYIKNIIGDNGIGLLTAGDTIQIAAGTYAETIVIDTNNIFIIGADSNSTIIDPPGSYLNTSLYGIYADSQNNIYVTNLKIYDCYQGINFYNVINSTINNVRIENCKYGDYFSAGIYLLNCDSISITQSHFQSNNAGIASYYSNDNIVYNNYCYNDSYGIAFLNGRNNYVYNNRILSDTIGLISIDCSANTIYSNNISFVNITGILVESCTRTLIDSNSIYGCSIGVEFSLNKNNIIKNNIIMNNQNNGIFLSSETGSIFINNIIRNNKGNGIEFNEAHNNYFALNSIDSNLNYGFYLYNSNNNNIENNNWTPSPYSTNKGIYQEAAGYVNDFRYNYWSSSDSMIINQKIQLNNGTLYWQPYRRTKVDTGSINADSIAPAAPSIFSIDTTTANQLTIKWTKPIYDEKGNLLGSADSHLAGYYIYRLHYLYANSSNDTNNWDSCLIATISDKNDTDYIDNSISAGETYFYRVSAFDSHYTNNVNFKNVSWYSNIYPVFVPIPPSIRITSPTNNYDTFNANINISGTAAGINNGDSVSIFLNNNFYCSAIINNNSWSANINLSVYQTSITAQIKNVQNLFAYDTIYINYYGTPKIEIISPSDNHNTSIQIIYISGTTYNSRAGDTIELFVNGLKNSTITLNSDSANFSGTVQLNNIGDSISVKLNGFSGLDFDTITINYFPPPTIKILSPENNYNTTTQIIYISGTTYNSYVGDTIQLFVNRIQNNLIILTVNNGTFSGTISISSTNSKIVARLNSIAGIAEDTITINYYGTPVIKITKPEDGHNTTTQIIYIIGTTYNSRTGDTIQLYVNQVLQSVVTLTVDSGTYIGTVRLSGTNDKIVARLNGFSGIAEDTITINYYGTPVIKITKPEDGHNTTTQIIYISGTTYNSLTGDTIQLYVNRVLQNVITLTVDSGTYTGTVRLSGTNDKIVARLNGFSGIAEDTITINYYGTPVIKITKPEDGHNTTTQIIYISGTTYNSRVGDTIQLYVNRILQNVITLTVDSATFSGTVYLSEMINEVVVRLNSFSRIVEDTITITFILTNKEIKILSPENEYCTTTKIITIKGTFENVEIGDSLLIYLNSILISKIYISDTYTWQAEIELSGFNNLILVKLFDKYGREYFDTATYHYSYVEQKVENEIIIISQQIYKNVSVEVSLTDIEETREVKIQIPPNTIENDFDTIIIKYLDDKVNVPGHQQIGKIMNIKLVSRQNTFQNEIKIEIKLKEKVENDSFLVVLYSSENEYPLKWQKIEKQNYNIVDNKIYITLYTNHFSYFGVFNYAPAQTLTNIRVYPNPYIMYSNSISGKIYDPTDELSGIIFDNLTENVTIKIFSLTGEIVRILTSNGNSKIQWDVRNQDGFIVNSGIYIYIIENNKGERKTGKLAIIR